ncbi:hypothetical protein PAESOLCIP111_05732 [Paenibacillus solanacearum]|uniref:DUF58 domain-containing protein n=1 Tax=Paenibacillus solanacearum TaxID=2048548 RepID=A0A916K715_9BACL|nr:DUF58 domain-containing protein [Paenibacillus solanacearum]CAG7648917.1 hypothetical protein PAESOLCIP111_05732 [Paenibacillus solanacearum]
MRSLVCIGGLVVLCAVSGWWAIEWDGRTAWFLFYSFAYLSLYALAAYGALKRGLARLEAGLSSQAGPIRRCYAGESVHYAALWSEASRLLPGARLHWEEQWVHQGTGVRTVVRGELAPGARLVRLPGLPRGVYVREALTVSASEALGLLHAERRSAGGGQLWVLPRPAAAAGLSGAPVGGRKAASPAANPAVPQVSGTRPYAPGDPLKRIHWRSTARTGELRATETELPAGGRQLVLLDAAGSGGSEGAALWADPLLAAAVEAAAGLARRGLERGQRVRLAVSDAQGSAAEAQGRARLPELLQPLAAVPQGGCDPGAFAALVRRETRRHAEAVALVTARADARLPAAMRGLPRGAAQVVFVHEPGRALPDAVHGWKRQLEAIGCRVTMFAAGAATAAFAPRQGGAGYAVIGE